MSLPCVGKTTTSEKRNPLPTRPRFGWATRAFVDYMLQEGAQKKLVRHGFRPANPKVDYVNDPMGKFFNSDIEVGDAPSNQQMLRVLRDIVSDDPKAKAMQF